MKSIFTDHGFAKTENRDYNPYLTITRIPRSKQGQNQINPSTYADLMDTEFGSQSIEGLELLEMGTTAKDGYYRCHRRLSFSVSTEINNNGIAFIS